jgi:hypothetical protein
MLRDYEHLASQVTLTNIFDVSADRRDDRGDEFDDHQARMTGMLKMAEWALEEDEVVVVACGHQVYRALTGLKAEFFKGRKVAGVEVWCFPHPSGASAFWNRQANVLRASNFLRRLLNRSGIMMAR